MRKTREVLRLKLALERSHRDIARSLAIGVGTVSECLARARAAGVDWAAAEALDDDALEARLYPSKSGTSRPLPDPA
jgi:DNA-directed RNA polymerase specialized sigma24 family protein